MTGLGASNGKRRRRLSHSGEDPLETYEEWDVTIPQLPPRSRLYRLEPIGIGTPYVESLTSYIARLAEAHCVTPKSLIMEEIMPIQSHTGQRVNYYSRLSKLWDNNAISLNGVTSAARQWVERLQALTTCENLRFLTMLTWANVIGLNKLLRYRKAWCPLCYEAWRQTHHVVYEPLLWALVSVTTCLKHRQPLVTSCPRCQMSSPFLTQAMRLGYCSHCGLWLGNALSLQAVGIISKNMEELNHGYWTTEVVGELLAGASHLPEPPGKEQIATMVSLYIRHYAKGNMSALARLVKLNVQTLAKYVRGTDVPYFDSLLHICSVLSITPLEFLTAKALPNQWMPQFIVDNLPLVSRGRRKSVSADDVQRIRQALEAVLSEERDPPSSLKEVADSIGYSTETMYRYCPDLSRRISARYRPHWTEDDMHRMKQELENALSSDEPISLTAVAQQLGCAYWVLRKRFPDLCRAVVKRYRDRFDYAQIHRRLQEILASDEESPSIEELARQMGYKSHIFQDNFPDLCNQVSRRHSAARREYREERAAANCREIRRVASLLHYQGIYPSTLQVSRQLGNLHITRGEEEHNAWRLALEELGYPTDHLKKNK